MAISSYPSGFRGGVLLKEVPLFDTIAGDVYWVDSGAGGDGNPGTYNRPLATVDAAVNKCTASNGDYIMLKPGHTEDIAAAGGAVFDIAGVTVVGLGTGSDMPQIHFTTSAAADIDVTAANVRFFNVRFTAGVADMTPGAISIGASAHNAEFHSCLFDEDGGGENYIICMTVADGADGLIVDNCDYRANDASNDNFISFAGTHENVKIVGNRMIHSTAQTAAAGMIVSATQMINCLIADNFMHSETAAVASSFVVLTGATNTGWAVNNCLSHVDPDATAANSVAAFDVTGLGSFNNKIAATGDIYGVEFATAEDLT